MTSYTIYGTVLATRMASPVVVYDDSEPLVGHLENFTKEHGEMITIHVIINNPPLDFSEIC